MIVTACIDEYFALMEEKPELFAPSEVYPIVTDREMIKRYEAESGKRIGVLYKSRFNTLVVDLIDGENGLFPYERVIPTSTGRGVVCIPVLDGKFLILNQYRHSIRSMQLCFPRGFGENGLSSKENAKKELLEETGACALDCIRLGEVSPDSGLIGTKCDVFLLPIASFDASRSTEGIREMQLCSPAQMEEKIAAGEINDAFTLSAFALYKASTRKFSV